MARSFGRTVRISSTPARTSGSLLPRCRISEATRPQSASTVCCTCLEVERLYALAASLGTRVYLSGGIKEAGKYESAVNDFLVWDTAKPKSGWQALPPVTGQPRFVHAMPG